METDSFTQTLNTKQFKKALAILRREQQANTPTPLQKKIFKILSVPIYGFTVVLAGFLLILVIYFADDSGGGWGWGLSFSPLTGLLIACGLLLTIYVCILVVGLLVAFCLNFSFLKALHRQNKIMKSLGLKEVVDQSWIKEQRKKTSWEIIFLCGSAGGLLTMLFVFGTGIYLLLEVNFPSLEFLGGVLLSILSIFSMIAIVVTNLARRNKVRLELISNLHTSLEDQFTQQGEGQESGISISAKDYQKIAQIERSQISRGRIESILADLEGTDVNPFVIQKSRAAQDAQGLLDTKTRLRVQEQIDALMTEPHPSGVDQNSKDGGLKMRVPQTTVVIGYTVDDNTRRIRILSVEDISEKPASASENGGLQHA
jgi:hypothetical protein